MSEKRQGRPSAGDDVKRSAVNLTATKGYKLLLRLVAERKADRDLSLRRTPRTTVATMGCALITWGLLDDPDLKAVLLDLETQSRRRGPEGQEAALVLRHWQQAVDEMDDYNDRNA